MSGYVRAPLRIRRSRWNDEAVEWLADKPLPEIPGVRGTVLRDVIDVDAVGYTEWWIDWRLREPDLPAARALEILRGEVEDAVRIHEAIAATVDHDDDPTVRPTLRALRRIAERLNPEETRP